MQTTQAQCQLGRGTREYSSLVERLASARSERDERDDFKPPRKRLCAKSIEVNVSSWSKAGKRLGSTLDSGPFRNIWRQRAPLL